MERSQWVGDPHCHKETRTTFSLHLLQNTSQQNFAKIWCCYPGTTFYSSDFFHISTKKTVRSGLYNRLTRVQILSTIQKNSSARNASAITASTHRRAMPLMVKILHKSPYTHSRFKVWLLPNSCFKDQTNLISVLVNHLMLVWKKTTNFLYSC